jgi:putative membrane protein
MKKLNLIVMIVLSGWMFQACNNTKKDSTASADSTNAVKDTTTTGKTGIAVDKDDAKFAVDAANGGMTEIALSKLAQTQATTSNIKDFATMMVTDHSKAGAELADIAKTKNITLPDSISAGSKKAVDDLSKKTGSDFDKAYVSKMVDDHQKTVDMFEKGAKNIKDPDLNAFVVKTLPIIKGHLTAIKAINAGMKK